VPAGVAATLAIRNGLYRRRRARALRGGHSRVARLGGLATVTPGDGQGNRGSPRMRDAWAAGMADCKARICARRPGDFTEAGSEHSPRHAGGPTERSIFPAELPRKILEDFNFSGRNGATGQGVAAPAPAEMISNAMKRIAAINRLCWDFSSGMSGLANLSII